MASMLQNQYNPDSVSAPGETLLETLEAIGMSQAELARRMGRPVKTINEIIQKKTVITAETALQLEQVLHVPASFWLKLEQQYREFLARLVEDQRLDEWVEWLSQIPIQEMMDLGWISQTKDKRRQVFEALKYFSVASPDAWQAVWERKVIIYRKSSAVEDHFGAVAAWLCQGEIDAQKIDTVPYNAAAFRDVLGRVRTLTVKPVESFLQELVNLCSNAGVAVVFVRELPYIQICGATQWLSSNKALIQLSQCYKTDDHFWFTFFHEAGHILLHGKKQVFLEMDQDDSRDAEDEADTFAENILIDSTHWRQFVAGETYKTKEAIKDFAQEIGIAPGIVVGRLQHERRLPYHHYDDLKCFLEWKDLDCEA